MRISICGAQGVGKTTLLNAIESDGYFDKFTKCREVTRWVKTLGFDINEQGSDTTQRLIMMKHIENLIMNSNMITDRSAIDGLVYSTWLHKNGSISDDTLEYCLNVFFTLIPFYDRVFYIKPEFDIEDDGVRSTNRQFRDEIEKTFEFVLDTYSIPYIILSGSVENRINQIKQELEI